MVVSVSTWRALAFFARSEQSPTIKHQPLEGAQHVFEPTQAAACWIDPPIPYGRVFTDQECAQGWYSVTRAEAAAIYWVAEAINKP